MLPLLRNQIESRSLACLEGIYGQALGLLGKWRGGIECFCEKRWDLFVLKKSGFMRIEWYVFLDILGSGKVSIGFIQSIRNDHTFHLVEIAWSIGNMKLLSLKSLFIHKLRLYITFFTLFSFKDLAVESFRAHIAGCIGVLRVCLYKFDIEFV